MSYLFFRTHFPNRFTVLYAQQDTRTYAKQGDVTGYYDVMTSFFMAEFCISATSITGADMCYEGSVL